jgi:hypothetical protein
MGQVGGKEETFQGAYSRGRFAAFDSEARPSLHPPCNNPAKATFREFNIEVYIADSGPWTACPIERRDWFSIAPAAPPHSQRATPTTIAFLVYPCHKSQERIELFNFQMFFRIW